MKRTLLPFFLLVTLCRGGQPLSAPPGYHSQRFGPLGGELFVPDSWKYREPYGPKGGTYIIAKEFAPDGSYKTGMRIQFLPRIKMRSGHTAKENVMGNLKLHREHETVVSECQPQTFGAFTRVCLETIGAAVPGEPNQQYHVIYAFWWSDQLDLIVAIIFGAPVQEWDAVRPVYDISGNIKIYDDDWVKAHAATHGVATTPAPATANIETPTRGASAAPPEPDPALDAVVKVGAIQFVNRIQDVQWRLGEDPAPLVACVFGMRRVMVDALQADGQKKPFVVNAMIGIPPKGRTRVWLMGWEGVLPPEKLRALTRALEAVKAPEVRNGPVAVDLTLELNGAKAGTVDPKKMPLPEDWRTAMQGRSGVLPDDLPADIWIKQPN